MIAVATVLAVCCKKDEPAEPEDNTLKLPNTSWAYNLETTFYGQTLTVDDTMNFVDNIIDRRFHFIAGTNERGGQEQYTYTWDGSKLVLLDSVGEPTPMTFTYRESDSVLLRDMDTDDDMVQIFQMLGISEIAYRRIK